MGQIRVDSPRVLPIIAAFSRYSELLDLVPQWVADHFGPVGLLSDRFAFTETDYYAPTMGNGLSKQLLALDALQPADFLAEAKCRANEIEASIARQGAYAATRPLNLDPGYLDLGKLVLASTKDHAHRVYLGLGVFGEVTLTYRDLSFQPWPWTYPDYRRDDVREFLLEARQYLRTKLEALKP